MFICLLNDPLFMRTSMYTNMTTTYTIHTFINRHTLVFTSSCPSQIMLLCFYARTVRMQQVEGLKANRGQGTH